tara:strand:+ start:15401 stop:15625 length:225 start_codon:yes stop_codon:yes gene_type:complete
LIEVQQLNLEIMARELSEDLTEFVYEYVKKYPHTTPAPMVSLAYMKELGQELRYMELRALVIKEMDRAKKRIKG